MNIQLFKTVLKESRKGLLIFCVILVLYGLLIMSVYPTIERTKTNPLVEKDDIRMEHLGGDRYNLSWDAKGRYPYHLAVGTKDIGSLMNIEHNASEGGGSQELIVNDLSDVEPYLSPYGAEAIYYGETTWYNFNNSKGYRFFLTLYLSEDGNISNATVTDIVNTDNLTVRGAFDEYIRDNPLVEGMMGGSAGSAVVIYQIEGFIGLEFFSIWTLVVAIYFGIKGLSTVTRHVEDRSLDILLATGYTRERFLHEKTGVVLIQVLTISFTAMLSIALGTVVIGKEVPWTGLLLATLGGIPYTLAFVAAGCLVSVVFNSYKKGLGAVLGFAFFQYVLQIISNISSKVEWIKWLTLFKYWDYMELLVFERMSAVNLIVPLVFALIVYAAAVIGIKRKEIPV